MEEGRDERLESPVINPISSSPHTWTELLEMRLLRFSQGCCQMAEDCKNEIKQNKTSVSVAQRDSGPQKEEING